jgi:hypothetical protein
MDKMNVIIDNIEKSMENYREFNGINEDIERYVFGNIKVPRMAV